MGIFGYLGVHRSLDSRTVLQAYGRSLDLPRELLIEHCRETAADCWGEAGESLDGVAVVLRGAPKVATDGAAPRQFSSVTPSQLLVRYRQFGEHAFDDLRGRFSVAILDPARDLAMLAVDPMGIESMAYAVDGRGLLFGSTAGMLLRAPDRRAELNAQALYDYLLLHMVPAPDTAFRRLSKLAAGTLALYKSGHVFVRRYWQPHFIDSTSESSDSLARSLRSDLAEAVRDCQPDVGTGAFLSGGLDSSSVAGMLAQVTGRPPRTFSIGFGVAEYNEIEYARIAARRFGASAHEYDVTPDDVVDALPRIAAAYDEPFGNSSAVPTYFCAKIARANGVHHLLAGDGGDEIFAGNERYAKQRVFEHYNRIPVGLRRALLEPLASRLPDDSVPWPLRKFRSYVKQARIPMPDRLEYWNAMHQADLGTMLTTDFRASVDPAHFLRQMRRVYGEAPSRDLTQRMLYFDWQYTLGNNDLRKVGTMCDLAGVRVSYPMLHPSVIDLSLRVPPAMMMPDGKLRHFYKQAMTGFLPDEIINKPKHGFGLPFGTWLKTHAGLRDLVYSLLSDFKQRDLVLPAFIDQLIEDHAAGHASFFGYALWDLAMLEAWLSSHRYSL